MSRRPGLARTALVAGGLLVGLALTEVILHGVMPRPSLYQVIASVEDPDLVFAPIPGTSVTFEGWEFGMEPTEVGFDEGGARRAPDGEPGCAEIWVAGDSVPFGWGVSDADTYAAALGATLAHDLGCTPWVRNWAVPGYNLHQSLARVRQQLPGGTPDLVLLHVDPSDGNPAYDYTAPLPAPRVLYRHSRIVLAASFAAEWAHETRTVSRYERGDDITLFETWLSEWARFSQDHGPPVFVLLEPDVPEAIAEQAAFDFAGSLALREVCSGDAMHLPRDDHYSVAGHRCIAEALASAEMPLPRPTLRRSRSSTDAE